MKNDDKFSVDNVIEDLPDRKSFENVSITFKLISDPSRLKILCLLCHTELCVNNIATIVKMSAPSVSHHLKLLKQAELIESQRLGKEIYYKLSDTEEAKLVHKAIDAILNIKKCFK
jgi:ArsR family transcriptional regulator, lead/cadmium/zinc/bismuth-responsive transcriptional repressor